MRLGGFIILKVQEHLLSDGTLDQLENDLSIRITRNTSDDRIILNYNQINSPKTNEIVRECRCLTLHGKTFELISRTFPRFFNWGEIAWEMPMFDWSSCFATEKADGSLLNLYYYDGWKINTRSTFGDGKLDYSGRSWSDVFFTTIDQTKLEDLDRTKSYVFEFWTPFNKIITDYGQPCSFLLTVYDGEVELEQTYSDEVSKLLKVRRPNRWNFSCIENAQAFVNELGKAQPSWEGIVLCDGAKRRWKVKNNLYVALHQLKNNGNLYLPKNLVPIILNGEIEEVLIYFPEALSTAKEIKAEIDQALIQVLDLWDEVKDIPDQKSFAQAVVPRTKFSSLLFTARKNGMNPSDLWSTSSDLILKVLYNEH